MPDVLDTYTQIQTLCRLCYALPLADAERARDAVEESERRMRRLIVRPRAHWPHGQRMIHWRYMVYQCRIGVVGLRRYRLCWSRVAGYRELNRRARAERDARLASFAAQQKKIAYIRRTAPLRAAAIAAESDGWRITGPEGGFVGWMHDAWDGRV